MTTPRPSPVSAEAQAAFIQNRTGIIYATVQRLLADPDVTSSLGAHAEQILTTGFEFTATTLEACIQLNNPALLTEQLAWSKDRLPHEGISHERLLKNLGEYCAAIRAVLPAAAANEIIAFLAAWPGAGIQPNIPSHTVRRAV